MYSDFYGFTGLPFQLTPDHRFFFGSRNHKKALAYLSYGLSQGEGFIVVTGDIGAGKTTLVGHLLATLDTASYVTGKVVTTQLDEDNLLRTVAAAFGLETSGRDKATLLHRLEGFLRDVNGSGKRAVLVVDEVQNVPIAALEELRMLSNFQVGERPLLQSFLLGQPQFRPTLASGALEQLRQRVIATYHLGPLDAADTQAYIEHRLHLVGWHGDPEITPDAFALIHANTRGVPRLINTFCTRVLLFGALEERHRIDGGCIDEVLRDLQEEGADTSAPSPADLGVLIAPEHVNGSGVPAFHDVQHIDGLADRVAALERAVDRQEQTIRRALDVAVAFLDSRSHGSRLR
jgi:putative secretion ATPase (PEP-CTERM system associated)